MDNQQLKIVAYNSETGQLLGLKDNLFQADVDNAKNFEEIEVGPGGGVESVTAGANGGLLFGGTETNPTIALAYKLYVATIIQNEATAAPIATVHENTLGDTPVWTRFNTGIYRLTLDGAFPLGKVWIPGFGNFGNNGVGAMPITDSGQITGYYYVLTEPSPPNRISLYVMDAVFEASDIFTLLGADCSICLPEIRVYP